MFKFDQIVSKSRWLVSFFVLYRIVYVDSQFLLLVHPAASFYILIERTFRDSMTQIFHILMSNSQRLSSTVSLREIEKLPLRIESPLCIYKHKLIKEMIVVKVTYSVHDDYVHTNKKMIESFLKDFRKLDGTQFLYTILQGGESNTFVHISQYKNKEIQDQLLKVPSFLHFQEQRDKNLAVEPKIELMNFIGSSNDSF